MSTDITEVFDEDAPSTEVAERGGKTVPCATCGHRVSPRAMTAHSKGARCKAGTLAAKLRADGFEVAGRLWQLYRGAGIPTLKHATLYVAHLDFRGGGRSRKWKAKPLRTQVWVPRWAYLLGEACMTRVELKAMFDVLCKATPTQRAELVDAIEAIHRLLPEEKDLTERARRMRAFITGGIVHE